MPDSDLFFLNRPVTKSQEVLQFKSSATYKKQLSMVETKKKKREEPLHVEVISFLTTNV